MPRDPARFASGRHGEFRPVRTMTVLFWFVIVGGIVAYTLTGVFG